MRSLALYCLSISLSLAALACGDSASPTTSDSETSDTSDSSATSDAQLTVCDMIPGAKFQTVEQFAQGPGGPLAHLSLSFDETEYARDHGDYLEEGMYTCADSTLMGSDANNGEDWTATINEDATMLVIDGSSEYERVDP